jgi:CheY-like chemotaxis protein
LPGVAEGIGPLLLNRYLRLPPQPNQELYMIGIFILLFIGFLLGLIILALLNKSSKKPCFKDHSSVSDELDAAEVFPNGSGNAICLGRGARRSNGSVTGDSIKKGRILFVDDEDSLVDIVDKMLKHLGYDVVAKNSSIDALNCLKSEPCKYDLIIIDHVMPELTGTEFALEAMRLQPRVPVILFTGFSDMIPKDKIKDLGIQEVVPKPIILSDLTKIINKYLKSKGVEINSPPSLS